MEDIIDIIVTETTNTIEITAQPNDEIIDVNIIDNREDIVLNVTPTVVEININSLTGNFGVEWGDITGTLADQEDLQDALDLKADLVDGKVPSSQLPSYVDDIVEVANYAALPATGEIGKIYVVLDTNKIYRWSGSAYIEIADSTAVWGAITGTLSSQTDLQSALDAKLSVTTAASTYVPYTGATASVDVGTNDLSGRYLNANGSAGLGGVLHLKQDAAYLARGNGYSTIASSGTLFQFFAYTGASTYKDFALRYDGLTDNTTRVYTLPDASGTLALTSDLSAYVPYTGATANVDLGTHTLLAAKGTFSSSGSADTVGITHSSGSGIALNISKAGNGEGIYVNKSSGSGNAVTIVGTLNATTLVRNGGTSSQFLKADGSVDSSVYALDSAVVKLTGNQSVGGIKTFTSGVSAELLWIKEGAGFANPAGYAQLATDITYFHFNNSNNTAYARFLYGSGLRTYTLPSSDGTLALTSALAFYLPLSGGTLTGALSGTSATFSSTMQINGAATGTPFGVKTATNQNWRILDNSGAQFDCVNDAGSARVDFRIGSQLYIASSGNVGIGTTSPANPISFIRLLNISGGDAALILSNSNGTAKNWSIGALDSGSLGIYDGSNPRMIVNSSGNVGIGTTAPTEKLHVANAGQTLLRVQNTLNGADAGFNISNNTVTAFMGVNATEGYMYTQSNHPIVFYTNTAERMRITSGGVIAFNGNSAPSSGGIDKFSMGFENGVDGWLQTWGGRPLSLNSQGNNVLIGTRTSNGNGILQVAGNVFADRYRINDTSGGFVTLEMENSSRWRINYLGRFSGYGAGALTTDASGNITAASDRTLKDIIRPVENVLENIMDFEPVYFKWNDKTDLDKENVYMSTIAQSIQKHYPDAVGKMADGTLTVQDRAVTAILVQAIKELTEKVKTLENK